MCQVVPKVQTAFPFDVNHAQIAPEILGQSRPSSFVAEHIIHALYVLDAGMSRYCLCRGNREQPYEERYEAWTTWKSELGKFLRTLPVVLTEFEVQVKRLGLSREQYGSSTTLRS
jgi:hypothetical protein